MRIDDIRGKINNSFLYKRFAYYQSEGFIELMKFLEDENIIDEFYEECNFKCSPLVKQLEFFKNKITLRSFFLSGRYSFTFANTRKGFDFWYKKIFKNKNFQFIENKLL